MFKVVSVILIVRDFYATNQYLAMNLRLVYEQSRLAYYDENNIFF